MKQNLNIAMVQEDTSLSGQICLNNINLRADGDKGRAKKKTNSTCKMKKEENPRRLNIPKKETKKSP